jgi:hypothetical protein
MCGYLSREITVFLVLAFKTDSVLSPDEKLLHTGTGYSCDSLVIRLLLRH